MNDLDKRELKRRVFFETVGRLVVVVFVGGVVVTGVLMLMSPSYMHFR